MPVAVEPHASVPRQYWFHQCSQDQTPTDGVSEDSKKEDQDTKYPFGGKP